jgi:hypothetical protein
MNSKKQVRQNVGKKSVQPALRRKSEDGNFRKERGEIDQVRVSRAPVSNANDKPRAQPTLTNIMSRAPTVASLSASIQRDLSRNLDIPRLLAMPRMTAAPISRAHRADAAPVPKPVRVVSEAEWAQALAACTARESAESPCPICVEPFAFNDQLILNCSHLFHRVCLRSFETLSANRNIVCPICRLPDYAKRELPGPSKRYLNRCATKIQSRFRGWSLRNRWEDIKKKIPPRDKAARDEWYIAQIKETNDNFSALLAEQDNEIDTLFAELDASLAVSQATRVEAEESFKSFEAKEWESIRSRALAREEHECPICNSNKQILIRVIETKK